MTASFEQLKPATDAYVWWVLHRPFLTPAIDAGKDHRAKLPAAFREPGALGAVFTGHQHMVALTAFADQRPPELITGNGGSSLEPEAAAGKATELFQGKGFTTRRTNTFGFLTLDRQAGAGAQWLVTEWDINGQELFRCTLKESLKHKSLLDCPPPAKT